MTNPHLEKLNEEVRQYAIEKELREGKPGDRIHRTKEINALYDMIRERIRQGLYGPDQEPVFAIKFPAPHAETPSAA